VPPDKPDDMARMMKVFAQVQQAWLKQPDKLMQAYGELWTDHLRLWTSSMQRMFGHDPEPVAEADRKDARFKDPAWSEGVFDYMKQAYLITSNWTETLVDEAEGLDPDTKHKAAFFTKQIVNALAPVQLGVLQPRTAARDLRVGRREPGARHAVPRRGHRQGRRRPQDPPGRSVALQARQKHRRDAGQGRVPERLFQLIQYEATTEKVFKRPLMIVPPWINKFYILDLTPEKSMVKWAVEQGHTVFMISWVNPDEKLAAKTFEDYMREGVLTALDKVCEATGEPKVNAIGYCVGGTLLSVTLAYMAAKKDRRVGSATYFASQVDFRHAGDLRVFSDEAQIAAVEREMAERGYLDSSKMAHVFNLMRSNDLIWPYIVNVYQKGKEPLPFDLLYWNSDSTRMPAANHSFYLRRFYLNNDFSEGRLEIGGVKLDLKKIKMPIYSVATREDHIAPARSVFVSAQRFGGPVRFILAGSGHIAGIIAPPAKSRYPHWTDGPPEGELEDWINKAEEHPGSWWPDWQEWVKPATTSAR
jgi:polyhydroxyalkanoate synthase subunit PhaC